MPKVSICIAVYNVEKYIEQCVRSLFEQTLDDLEYVFVDDASPDSSIDIMLRILEEYPHRKEQVKLIRHENNCGIAATRQDAIAAATGDYIIHCDPDDWVELNMYETLYNKAVEFNADMVYCNVKSIGWGGSLCTDFKLVDPPGMIRSFFSGEIHAGLCNKLWRSQIVKKQRILPDEVFICEDMRLNIQYLLDSDKCHLVSDSLYFYRKSDTSISCRVNANMVACQLENILFYEKLLGGANYKKDLNKYKREILLQSIICGGIPHYQWYFLWWSSKVGILKDKYPLRQKLIFILACINYPFAKWLWKAIRERKRIWKK